MVYNSKKYKKYYQEKRKLYYQTRYKKHKKRLRKINQAYSVTPAGIYCMLKWHGTGKKYGVKITKEQFIKWYKSQKRVCHYCKRTEIECKKDASKWMWAINSKRRLSIDRRNNEKGYTLKNMVLSCYVCNKIKGNFFTETEMKQVGKIVRAKLKR